MENRPLNKSHHNSRCSALQDYILRSSRNKLLKKIIVVSFFALPILMVSCTPIRFGDFSSKKYLKLKPNSANHACQEDNQNLSGSSTAQLENTVFRPTFIEPDSTINTDYHDMVTNSEIHHEFDWSIPNDRESITSVSDGILPMKTESDSLQLPRSLELQSPNHYARISFMLLLLSGLLSGMLVVAASPMMFWFCLLSLSACLIGVWVCSFLILKSLKRGSNNNQGQSIKLIKLFAIFVQIIGWLSLAVGSTMALIYIVG